MILVYHYHRHQMVAKIEDHEKYVEPSPNGIAVVMKSVIDFCNDNTNGTTCGNEVKEAINRELVVMIEGLPTKDLYTTIK